MVLDVNDSDPVGRACALNHRPVLNGAEVFDAIGCKVGSQGWVKRLLPDGTERVEHGFVSLAVVPASPVTPPGAIPPN